MLVCKVQSTPAGVELTDSGGGDADDDKSVKDTDRGIIDPDTTASKTFNTWRHFVIGAANKQRAKSHSAAAAAAWDGV